MMHVFRFVVLSWFCCTGLATFAQGTAGYGDWQLYLPANHPLVLADAGDRLYVATESSLFYLNKALETTQLLSRRDGLHDVGVAALAYDSAGRQTLLAYRNGNLDIIKQDGTVRNIPDVVRKNIQGNKTIYQVVAAAKSAYVATSFGLLHVDLEKLEVRDTYSNIGAGGKAVEVYSAAVWHDTLYVATTDGLLRGALQANLLDFRNWTREPDRSQFRWLAVQNGYVYAVANNAGIFRLSGVGAQRQWRALPNTYSPLWRQLRASKDGLLAMNDQAGVLRLNPATGVISTLIGPAAAGQTLDIAPQSDGSYFLASYDQGLIRLTPGSGQAAERFVPNQPAASMAFNILADARTNTVDVFSGGYSDRFLQLGNRGGFYEYQNGQWNNFTSQTLPATDYPNLLDITRGTRTLEGTLYIASYGNGVLEWQGPGKFRQLTQGTPGSPLLSAIASEPNYTRITDVATDAEGDVWVVNRHGRVGLSGLFIFKPSTDTWETVPYFPNSNNLDRIVFDDTGVAWVSEARKEGSGLWAVDRAGTNTRRFSSDTGLPSNEIYDLVKDRRGFIWVATGKGVASFDDPSQVFEPSSEVRFQLPFVRRGEGSGFPALWTEPVRCVAIDGGNRKWFGTDNGLWLFSEDVNEALLHFTTANSPLPSNRIVDVAVNDKTGEVFVATDAGLVSYRGAATVTEGAPNCAQAFPNPVRPGFSGQVGINGLANNAEVKITDVAGKLVYSTRANGGTVTWNLNDANGHRVRSGVYLVLSADADGKNSCVSKVAVL
jgi:ligand-binding sensor domain-containing protein